jgi:peptidoglycan/xylan/chitin deacetylase (PgdA/CDA1 family)
MSNPRIPYRFSTSRPKLPAPGGKPLIVHFVVNVEHWRFDQPMPRAIVTPPHGKETVPDVPNFSWVEYGMRCGLPRILDVLSRSGIPASTSINAGVIDAYPEAAEAMRDAGWEFIGHGLHQQSLNAAASERDVIAATLEKLERFTGKKTRGWLSPGLRETLDTPDVLKACGVDYVCDWVLEDLPVWMTTAHGPLIAMPYSLEINDTIIYLLDKHAAPEMFDRVAATVQTFERERRDRASGQVRVLTLGLHPHLIGVPHRIAVLERIVEFLRGRPEATFMRGSELADWFVSAAPSSPG